MGVGDREKEEKDQVLADRPGKRPERVVVDVPVLAILEMIC